MLVSPFHYAQTIFPDALQTGISAKNRLNREPASLSKP
jgi:hypothetical protein